jgi:hypothetical protein
MSQYKTTYKFFIQKKKLKLMTSLVKISSFKNAKEFAKDVEFLFWFLSFSVSVCLGVLRRRNICSFAERDMNNPQREIFLHIQFSLKACESQIEKL